ncbi:hypothetical protein [Phenylobacterium sp.]|uniref:hypothetical protein n=1 Tax=Phenylobacterium sp. TaxID=1871053 RepID=UPI002FE1C143
MHPALAEAVADLVPPRVTFGELVARAGRVLAASPAAVWALWAALAGLYAAQEFAERRLGLGGEGASPTPALWATTVAGDVVAVALSGLAVRRWLAPERGWRLDLGFWTYVALAGLASLSFSAPDLLGVTHLLAATDRGGPGEPWSSFAELAFMLALAYPLARLMLWPTARLVGDPGPGPRGSWRAMPGAVWPYIGAVVLPALALMILVSAPARLLAGLLLPRAAWVPQLIEAVTLALVEAFAAAAAAVVYRQRARAEAGVAEVFD